MGLARISRVPWHAGLPTQFGRCVPHQMCGGIPNAKLPALSVTLACHLAALRQQAVTPYALMPSQFLNAKMLTWPGVCVQAQTLGGRSSVKLSVKAFFAGTAFRHVLSSARLFKDARPVTSRKLCADWHNPHGAGELSLLKDSCLADTERGRYRCAH